MMEERQGEIICMAAVSIQYDLTYVVSPSILSTHSLSLVSAGSSFGSYHRTRLPVVVFVNISYTRVDREGGEDEE